MPRRVSLPLAIGALILAVGLLQVSGVLAPVESAARWALLPLARAFAAIGFEVSRTTGSEDSPEAMRERIQELESRVSTISLDYVRLRSLEEENRSLRELAGFLKDSGYDHVGARVIARHTDANTAQVLIDRGSTDGLEYGMAVVAENGLFVGKISSLKERVATVELVTDVQSRLAASLPGAKKLIGLVQGEGNGVARVTLVPQTEPLERDDIIVTAGTEEKIPPNLSIALVNQVEGKPTDPFKTAVLEPLIQIADIDLVIVLRPAALRPSSP